MAKAISTIDSKNLILGRAYLGDYSGRTGSPAQLVHDGDTVNVKAAGNFGVRMLGIDTPEVSFSLPSAPFVSLKDERWTKFLTDPFAEEWGPMEKLPPGLIAFLKAKVGPYTAADHFKHADAARIALTKAIEDDRKVMGTGDQFKFFLLFGFEVMDAYGRLLCLMNREQRDKDKPTKRPNTYNLRLLEQGLAFPYFIWPNINPWDKPDSVMDAVFKPGTIATSMKSSGEIQLARAAVRNARQKHLGLFDAMRPMLLEPFELRMLARRGAPSRFLIDMTKNDDVLIHPKNYWTVPHSEDRLWIPKTYVPLFVENGWNKQADPTA